MHGKMFSGSLPITPIYLACSLGISLDCPHTNGRSTILQDATPSTTTGIFLVAVLL